MTLLNYTINYVDLIIVGIIALLAITGSMRGIAITIVNFLRFVIGMPLCLLCSARATEPIYTKYVNPILLDKITQSLNSNNDLNQTISNINTTLSELPSFITNSFNLSTATISKLTDTTAIASYIVDKILQPIALAIIKGTIFVVIFILFFGLSALIVSLIRRHNKKKREKNGKSTLKNIDRIIGCSFGILKGLIVVFTFVSVINYLICNFDYTSNQFLSTASDSILFNQIVSFNPLNFITEGII